MKLPGKGGILLPRADARPWSEVIWVKQGSRFEVTGSQGTLLTLRPPSDVPLPGWRTIMFLLAGLEMFVPDPSHLVASY